MKVLVTGANGFLGSALCRHLAESGHDAVALVRCGSTLQRLAHFEGQVESFGGAVEVADVMRRCRPEAVIHTACAYGRQGESLLQLADANIALGIMLLQALSDTSRQRLPTVFLNTGTALPRNVSLYALSKHQFPEWGRRIAKDNPDRLQFVNVELQHMYGPGDDLTKFTTHVMHACRRHTPFLELTAGEQRRDFIHLDDVVGAYACLLAHAAELPGTLDVPLGSGEAPCVRDYVMLVHGLCASRTELRFGVLPYRIGEAMHCQADLTLMRSLGWTPRWTLRDGLRRTLELEDFK